MEDLGSTRDPLLLTSPPETGADEATALLHVSTHDEFNLNSFALTDLDEKLPFNVRQVSPASDGPAVDLKFDKDGQMIFQLGDLE